MFVAEIANKLSLCNNCLSERSYKYDHLVKLSEAEIFNINIKRTFITPRCQKCIENIQTASVTSRCINNPPLYCFVQPTPRLWQHAEMQSLMTNIIANSRPPIGPIRHSIHHQRPRLSFIAIPIEVSAFLGATLGRNWTILISITDCEQSWRFCGLPTKQCIQSERLGSASKVRSCIRVAMLCVADTPWILLMLIDLPPRRSLYEKVDTVIDHETVFKKRGLFIWSKVVFRSPLGFFSSVADLSSLR